MGTKKASKIMNIIITATAPIAITTILTLSVFSIQDSFPFITSDIQEQAFAQTTTDENNQQIDAQVDRPEATAGNVTADIKPQGTSLDAIGNNASTSEGLADSNAGNITAPIAPQGTAFDVANNTSLENRPEATAGNVTADIKPQGTTLGVED